MPQKPDHRRQPQHGASGPRADDVELLRFGSAGNAGPGGLEYRATDTAGGDAANPAIRPAGIAVVSGVSATSTGRAAARSIALRVLCISTVSANGSSKNAVVLGVSALGCPNLNTRRSTQ